MKIIHNNWKRKKTEKKNMEYLRTMCVCVCILNFACAQTQMYDYANVVEYYLKLFIY